METVFKSIATHDVNRFEFLIRNEYITRRMVIRFESDIFHAMCRYDFAEGIKSLKLLDITSEYFTAKSVTRPVITYPLKYGSSRFIKEVVDMFQIKVDDYYED